MIRFVTSNRGKFVEAQSLIEDLVQADLGYTEIQADTLEEVVLFGMRELSSRLDSAFIIEDAGLFIEALNGFPGVYSAYVQRTIGNSGILKLMEGIENRAASFRSVVGFSAPGMEPVLFKGELHGRIGFEERGTGGFGYDPIFEVDGRTLAEMELEEKNMISHRGRSMKALKRWLESR
ncbi:MAG: XTP/dITP diphosphatase [Methanothrix sp.]|uniref:XTP/dITP diphosphatase n=1 Tax=Methanothrix sp. TaxID=90426 RepID=UPI0025D9D34C|nr:XTP/dITP diphosphatase [Methanothrix sp.]MCQ8903733.1 XTP/dITP diphosphatase [Methanothrix sp.]